MTPGKVAVVLAVLAFAGLSAPHYVPRVVVGALVVGVLVALCIGAERNWRDRDLTRR